MQRAGRGWLAILAIACCSVLSANAQIEWRCPTFNLDPGVEPSPLIRSAAGCVARYAVTTTVLAAPDVEQIIMPVRPAGSKFILQPIK
jgi:hypothetical protein